jgi:PilZ domain
MVPAYLRGMRIPTRDFKRKVRRARHISARVVQPGHPDQECAVMDISQNGAKIVVGTGSMISTRFELAFDADNRRVCDLVWRRGNTLGVRFFA